MTSRKIVLLVGAAAAVAAGVWYFAAGASEVPQFATQPVTRGPIVQLIGATGALEAVTTVQVGTQVSGTVLALNADFNSVVRKGQVIARLDPSLFQTQLEQARANLTKAEADQDRLRLMESEARRKLEQARQLSAKGLLPASDLDAAESDHASTAAQVRSAEASVTQSRASVRQAQVSLDKTVITSPIAGIVIARNVDVGQTVAASLQAPTLFVIAADLTKMRVNASVHEADVGLIRPGQAVTFHVDAFPSDEFPGTVSLVRLNPIVQQNVVTYATLIDVPNTGLKLKPGMTATVTIRIAERRSALRVPNAALRFRPTTDVLARLGQTANPAQGPTRAPSAAGAGAGRGRSAAAPATPATGELFGPLEEEETIGQIWLYAGGQLTSRRVTLGISDDTYTELLSDDLPEGTEIVTSATVAATASTTTSPSTTGNPLMPQRPSGPRGGGR